MNNYICTGRLVRDPEGKITTAGKDVVTFSLAVETGWGDKKQTSFPTFVAWEAQARYLLKAHKGDKILVARSELTMREYTNKQGQKVHVTEFVVRELENLGGPRSSQSAPQAAQQQDQSFVPASGQTTVAGPGYDSYAPIDDVGDLPF